VTFTDTTTTTEPLIPSIWCRLHEPKENYAGSGTKIKILKFCCWVSNPRPACWEWSALTTWPRSAIPHLGLYTKILSEYHQITCRLMVMMV